MATAGGLSAATPTPTATSGPGLADIDWSAPWLTDWRATGEPMARQILAGTPQPQALQGARRAPVDFVPQDQLPPETAYEAYIAQHHRVPTREGLHDFFNALCWMHFPQAKRQLNRLQAAEIARDGVQARRGPVRDACTVFDENALLLQAPEPLWQALREHRWRAALLEQRALWAQARVWTFGHATLEKLVRPYKSITAHVWPVPEHLPPQALDAWLAQDLQPQRLAAKPFTPLPVLGIPGWWPANEAAAFYDDPQVFRPRRRPAATQKPYAGAELQRPA